MRTIRNVLKDEGLNAYRPRIIPLVSAENRQKRLEFCKTRQKWTAKWSKVVFSDESYLSTESNRLRFVRRYFGEQLTEEYCIKKTRFSGTCKIMVWAAISSDGPEQIHFVDGTMNSTLYKHILDANLSGIRKLWKGEYIFMQDNATPHKS